jgi:hypothetical protein
MISVGRDADGDRAAAEPTANRLEQGGRCEALPAPMLSESRSAGSISIRARALPGDRRRRGPAASTGGRAAMRL